MREHANGVGGVLLDDDDPMYARAEDFDGLGEGRGVRQGNEGFFAAKAFDVFERDGFALAAFLSEFAEGGDLVLVGLGEADDEEEISVQVAVVERADGRSRGGRVPEKHDVGRAGRDEEIGGFLHAGGHLGEPHLLQIDDISDANRFPVSPRKLVAAPAFARGRVVQQILHSGLRHARMPVRHSWRRGIGSQILGKAGPMEGRARRRARNGVFGGRAGDGGVQRWRSLARRRRR